MTQTERPLSPAQLARALGLGESTVKRWIDHGRIPAERTPGGHRRVRLSDAVALLRSQGVGADPRLLGFSCSDHASPDALTSILCSNSAEQATALLEGLYASGTTPAQLADDWIAPAMHQIGHSWSGGDVTVTSEHRATAVMLAALHGLQRVQKAPGDGAPCAFVAGLSGDPYLLAPLCVALVLREVGFKTANYGPDTPAESLIDDIRALRPALVALSFSVPDSSGARTRAGIRTACQEVGAALVVGGRGLCPELVDELRATAWCRSMLELDRIARHLAGRSSRDDLAHTG